MPINKTGIVIVRENHVANVRVIVIHVACFFLPV